MLQLFAVVELEIGKVGTQKPLITSGGGSRGYFAVAAGRARGHAGVCADDVELSAVVGATHKSRSAPRQVVRVTA